MKTKMRTNLTILDGEGGAVLKRFLDRIAMWIRRAIVEMRDKRKRMVRSPTFSLNVPAFDGSHKGNLICR